MPDDGEPHSTTPPSPPKAGDWRELAEAAKNEQNPARLLAIIQELNRVLAAAHPQDILNTPHTAPRPRPDTDEPNA